MNSLSLGFFGFWIFCAVYLYVDHIQYLKGHDTLFFSHKTPEEECIREAQIKYMEAEAKLIQLQAQLLEQKL